MLHAAKQHKHQHQHQPYKQIVICTMHKMRKPCQAKRAIDSPNGANHNYTKTRAQVANPICSHLQKFGKSHPEVEESQDSLRGQLGSVECQIPLQYNAIQSAWHAQCQAKITQSFRGVVRCCRNITHQGGKSPLLKKTNKHLFCAWFTITVTILAVEYRSIERVKRSCLLSHALWVCHKPNRSKMPGI